MKLDKMKKNKKNAQHHMNNNNNSVAYSKETIGQFQRVKNQGTTCYLNTLLQSLYFYTRFVQN